MTPLEPQGGDFSAALPPPGQRIALAEDAAFSFLYPHVARHWRKAGAEIVPFSPLADEAPDESCDVCWLPGGYPELHAGKLAAAAKFRAGMRKFAETKPVHGECGGFMVLGEGLEDADGERHEMLGLLGHSTSFAKRKMNLGYRQAKLTAGSALGPAGAAVRGHEFHYAQMTEPGADEPLAELADGQGNPLGAFGRAARACQRDVLPRHREGVRDDARAGSPTTSRSASSSSRGCRCRAFDFRGRTLAQAIWAAPLVGVAVAVAASIAHALASAVGLSPEVAAALALGTAMLVTGCLHEDGLSDVADGFGGGRTREQKARDHARQPHRRLWRVGADHVGADPLERDLATRQPVLGVLRAGRRACRVARAAAGLHASRAARPRGRARGRRGHGLVGHGLSRRWRSARWRCWRSACPDWSPQPSASPSSSSASARSACARSAARPAIRSARCSRLGEIAVLLVAAAVLLFYPEPLTLRRFFVHAFQILR